jgi:hypothetical protein
VEYLFYEFLFFFSHFAKPVFIITCGREFQRKSITFNSALTSEVAHSKQRIIDLFSAPSFEVNGL